MNFTRSTRTRYVCCTYHIHLFAYKLQYLLYYIFDVQVSGKRGFIMYVRFNMHKSNYTIGIHVPNVYLLIPAIRIYIYMLPRAFVQLQNCSTRRRSRCTREWLYYVCGNRYIRASYINARISRISCTYIGVLAVIYITAESGRDCIIYIHMCIRPEQPSFAARNFHLGIPLHSTCCTPIAAAARMIAGLKKKKMREKSKNGGK